MIKKLLSVCICLITVFSYSFSRSPQSEEKMLVSNMNYLQYSVSKIKNTDSRITVEDEYNFVMNQLDYSFLNNTDLRDAYNDFLMECRNVLLIKEEKEFLKQQNQKKLQNAWKKAFSSPGAIFVPGKNWKEMAASLVYTTVANLSTIENQKTEAEMELDEKLFYLDNQQLSELIDMQNNVFSTVVDLLSYDSKYKVITENSMRKFVEIEKMTDPVEIKELLENSEYKKDMKDFPPYWYLLGKAYQDLGNPEKAMRAYDKFEELKEDDVINKDKTYVKVLRNKIQIYLDNNPKNHIRDINLCIRLINLNTLSTDIGEKESYLGKIYFIINDFDSARECVNYILNTKTKNSEYLIDAVNLLLMINAVDDNYIYKNLYQNVLEYDCFDFGYDIQNDLLKKEKYKNLKYLLAIEPVGRLYLIGEGLLKIIPNIKDFINIKNEMKDKGCITITRDEFEKNEKKYVKKYLTFIVPSYICNNYNLTLTWKDYKFEPLYIDNNVGEYTMSIVKLSNEELQNGGDLKIELNKKSDNTTFMELEYEIKSAKEKYIRSFIKAADKIGTDFYSVNADLAYKFGYYLEKHNYKYAVDDVNKEYKKLWKEYEKEIKDYTILETEKQKEKEVQIRLNEKLVVDLKNLSDIFKNVADEFYSQKNSLFNPNFFYFDEETYIIGLKSLTMPSTNHKIYFDGYGLPLVK